MYGIQTSNLNNLFLIVGEVEYKLPDSSTFLSSNTQFYGRIIKISTFSNERAFRSGVASFQLFKWKKF